MMDADTMVLPRLGPAEPGVEDPWGEDRPPRRGRVAARSASGARGWRAVPWLPPALLAGGLGGAGLGAPGPRAGELATWHAATAGWRDALTGGEAASVPYHLLVRGSAELFGTSDVALRLPSLLAVVAAAALVGGLATRLFAPGVGVLAGLLLAVLPTTIRLAQEAQPHAVALCAAVLATRLLLPVLDRPTARRLAAYAGAVLLLGLCAPGALLLLAGHGWVVLAFRRRSAGRWVAAVAPAVLLVAAALRFGGPGGGFLPAGVRPDPAALAAAPRELFGVAALGAVLAGLALFSLPLRYAPAICTAWAVVPASAMLLAAWAVPVWSPAALFFTLPAWAVLGAVALSRLGARWALVGLAAIALLGVPARATGVPAIHLIHALFG
ncbi:glycosyltransferase family 39 protein [Micromonospora sp. WMMD980]|uniref:glycosyltransferase family 39 protein n=1 Tax=Micromonospora sp. WMMD980 TaxID=3016088 RepID=UPI002416D1F1|nr:glycosyltransferase family 39 protein [Micromonospora sp. WMMD980]MDG4800397.1 glycosyltransferase family 39 protein [Micromonospora sp. WMMD980]